MTRVLDLHELTLRLAGMPTTLRSLAGTLPAEAVAFREAPERWTPFEVLCHLVDAEVHNWIPRIRLILSGADDKRFTPFDREQGLRRYRDWPLASVLDELEERRRDSLLALDAFGIQPGDLRRQALHPELGPVTLEQLLASWVTHDHAHLAQISRALVRCFGRDVGPWAAYFSLLRG